MKLKDSCKLLCISICTKQTFTATYCFEHSDMGKTLETHFLHALINVLKLCMPHQWDDLKMSLNAE